MISFRLHRKLAEFNSQMGYRHFVAGLPKGSYCFGKLWLRTAKAFGAPWIYKPLGSSPIDKSEKNKRLIESRINTRVFKTKGWTRRIQSELDSDRKK